jgi:GT2 family glycosyltransferase
VKVIDPGYNIGFARGHNQLFAEVDADFFQLVNPDLVLTPTFIEEMLKPFADPKVGAVSGKILRYDFDKNQPTNIIDTTGVVIQRSGRGRDRGQHQRDIGQFDDRTDLIAASGAAVMYRKAALEDVKYQRPDGRTEYFDEDFHTYWEDVDLAWRMVNAGWKVKYAPNAVAYHGRAAGSSPGGYKRVLSYIKHHRAISPWVRQLNYKNHIFLFLKNSPKLYWQFIAREFFYQIYVLFLETTTLKVLPTFFKQLPLIWKKRKHIQQHRKISIEEMEKLFV